MLPTSFFYLQLILVQAENALIIFKWPEHRAHKRPLIKLEGGGKSVVDKMLSVMVWGYDFLLQPFIFYSRQFLWLVCSHMHLWPPRRCFLSIKVSQKRQLIKPGALTRGNRTASSKQNSRIQMICKSTVDRQHFYEGSLSPVLSLREAPFIANHGTSTQWSWQGSNQGFKFRLESPNWTDNCDSLSLSLYWFCDPPLVNKVLLFCT